MYEDASVFAEKLLKWTGEERPTAFQCLLDGFFDEVRENCGKMEYLFEMTEREKL